MDLGGTIFNSTVGNQQKASQHGVVLHQFSQGFSTWACFRTGCCRPTAVLNSFKLIIVVVMTKLIVTTGN